MFFRCNEGKGLVVPKDGKDDIADLAHNSADSCHLRFRFTFLGVVVLQHRVLGVTGAGGTNGLHSNNIDHPSGVAGTAFREPESVPTKLPNCFTAGSKPK